MYRRGDVATRVAAALAVGAMALVPVASEARPVQEDGGDSGGQSALVEVEVDVERADEADLAATFSDVRDNVEQQRAELARAEQAVVQADFVLRGAQAKVDETRAQISMLVAQADAVVVQAFVGPAAETAVDAMATRDPNDASMKQAILDMQADADADALAELEEAQEQLRRRKRQENEAATAAEQSRAGAEAALADLRAAASQEVEFAAEVEARLARNLAEAAGLEEIDPALAERLRAEQGNLAMQIAASRTRLEQERVLAQAGVDDGADSSGPSTIEPVGGGVVAVSCPSGGSIEVAGDIARDVQGLLNRAWDQGVGMCGNGYRDPSEQVALRRSNCGSSRYAIYEAPASSCSPPTAPPGSSMHERGLAIDFTSPGGGAIGCRGSVYNYLDDNASDFGFYNLPGECWHWSTNGQ